MSARSFLAARGYPESPEGQLPQESTDSKSGADLPTSAAMRSPLLPSSPSERCNMKIVVRMRPDGTFDCPCCCTKVHLVSNVDAARKLLRQNASTTLRTSQGSLYGSVNMDEDVTAKDDVFAKGFDADNRLVVFEYEGVSGEGASSEGTPLLDEESLPPGSNALEVICVQSQEPDDPANVEVVGHLSKKYAERSICSNAMMATPALLLTLGIEMIVAGIINSYGALLGENIILVNFLPVVSAVAANIGLQSSSVNVRGLDTGYVSSRLWRHLMCRAIMTATVLAFVFSALLGGIAYYWTGGAVDVVLIVSTAMFASSVIAGASGCLTPILVSRVSLWWGGQLDPALAAGPLETALQDVVGFGVFLVLASWFHQAYLGGSGSDTQPAPVNNMFIS